MDVPIIEEISGDYEMTAAEKRMGQLLLEQELVPADGIRRAIEHASATHISFQASLIQLHLIRPEDIGRMLALTDRGTRLAPADPPPPPDGEPDPPPGAPSGDPASAAGDGNANEAPGAEDPEERSSRLGTYMVEKGQLSREQLDQALEFARDKNVMLGAAMVALRYVSEEQLSEILIQHAQQARKHQGRQKRLRLGEILVEQKVVTPEQLQEALAHARDKRMRLGEALTDCGFVTEKGVALALSRQLAIPLVNLSRNPPDPALLVKVPRAICEKHRAMPFRLEGRVLSAAMVDPLNIIALDDFKNLTGCTVLPVIAIRSDFEKALAAYYGSESTTELLELIQDRPEGEAEGEFADSNSAPIIQLVNRIIGLAVQKGISDIHIDPQEDRISVRFRLDGILRDFGLRIPREAGAAIASRIKVMTNLDIAEHRLPQDGKFRYKVEGKVIDFRVSVLPVVWGSKIVIRLLDQSKARATIDQLEMESSAEAAFREGITTKNGIVLVTGPTGSGKSTSLYAALLELNTPVVNIQTAEDPVEFTLPGVIQSAVSPRIGLTFAQILRSFLRQDPDVIVLGEIRDTETASIALKSAMTGHLVLSTLHTNDAIQTVDRLIVMGMDRFVLASTLRVIVAQRLVRKLCEMCKTPMKVTPEFLETWGVTDRMIEEVARSGVDPAEFALHVAAACDKCSEGYRGRSGVYETLRFTEEMREMIVLGSSNKELHDRALQSGMFTLRQSALMRTLRGLTTTDEVARITVTPPSSQKREAYVLADDEPEAGRGVALDPAVLETVDGLVSRLEALGRPAAGGGAAAAAGPTPELADPVPPGGGGGGGGGPPAVSLTPGLVKVGQLLGESLGALRQGRDPTASGQVLERAQVFLEKLSWYAGERRPVVRSLRLPFWKAQDLPPRLERLCERASLIAGGPIAPDRVTLSGTTQRCEKPVKVDTEWLWKCVDELVENALCVLPEGGRVQLVVKDATVEGSSFGELTVVDNGPGMPAEVRERALDPFYSTRPGGLGLGLPMVRAMVESMGGTVAVLSRPGKGCAVRIRFPA